MGLRRSVGLSVRRSVRRSVYRCSSETAWWIFFKFWEMIVWVKRPGRVFRIFDWNIFDRFMTIFRSKLTILELRSNFLKNGLITFFLFAANEPSWCHLQLVQTPFWLKCSKWVKLTYLGQIWPTFTHFARFLANCLMNFLHFAANDTSWHILGHV